jgi:hypothetical protein
MVRQNERFRLPVSGQFRYLAEAWIDRFSRRPVALPAFSPSLAEQTELHRHRPSRLAINRRKADTSAQTNACLASASATRFRDF